MFPDLVHSINQHRASYYMLNQKVVFVNKEKLKGAIGDRAAERITQELKSKIKKIEHNVP